MSGHEEPLADCHEALRAYASLWTGTRRVLCLEGMSGTGKSTFLRYLAAQESTRPVAIVDLAEIPLTREDIVGALREQIGVDRCPDSGTVSLKTGVFSRIEGSPVTVVTTGSDGEFTGLDHLAHREWLLLVDHCDELDAVGQLRRWTEGRFVPYLLGRFPGLRVVLAAERGPRGPRYESFSHRLRTWTRPETAAYLARWGLTDPQVSAAVHDASDGLGLFARIAGETWYEAERSGRRFDLPDMAGHSLNAWLFERVIAAAPGPAETVRAVMRLRWFSVDLLEALGAGGGLSERDYYALTTCGWVTRLSGGGHAVYPRVRLAYAGWSQAARPEEFRAFHSRAARIFAERGDDLNVTYHHLNSAPAVGFMRWAEVFDAADEAGRLRLAGLVRLPEIWAWLGGPQRAAWRARVGDAGLTKPAADGRSAGATTDFLPITTTGFASITEVSNTNRVQSWPPISGPDVPGWEGAISG